MTVALAQASRPLLVDLHEALRTLDPARWRAEKAAQVRAQLERVAEGLAALAERFAPETDGSTLLERLQAFVALLRAQLPNLPEPAAAEEWVEVRQNLQPAYEDLVQAMREKAVHVPSLRPTNYVRNLFHVLNSIVVIAVIELVPYEYIMWPASCALASVWFLEISRRFSASWNAKIMKLFGPVAHPYENHRVNSGTWFVSALFLLALTGRPELGAMGVAVLGFADPAAALVGRRFGKHKLVNGRTFEGSAAFFLVGTLAVAAVLTVLHPGLVLGWRLAMVAAGAALTGTLAELFSFRVDDNLSIPLATALAGFGLLLI